MSPARRNDLVMVAAGALTILLDQLTKYWIVQYFGSGAVSKEPPIALLGQILQLQYIQNTGVAFSLFEGQAVMFLLIAIAIGVIGYLYWRMRDTGSLLLKLTFGLILGGAIGNLIDRFTRHYVVDFIHFQIPAIHFDFAVFNVADSAISIGVVLLAYLLWRSDSGQHAPAPKQGDAAISGTQPPASTPAAGRKVTTSGR